MTLWMVWSVVVSGVVALAAAALERGAVCLGAPRRFVWIGAMVLAAAAPCGIAFRRVPMAPAPAPHQAPPNLAVHAALGVPEPPRPDANGAGALPSALAFASHASAPAQRLAERVVNGIPAAARAMDPWVAGLWLVTSLSLVVVFGRALLRLRRQQAHWREIELESCTALIAANAGPAVVGFAHPRIVVPEWAVSLDRTSRSLLLRHETEHIRAGDPRALLGGLLLLIAFPWNAALWWMSRQLRVAIEIDCDARVIRAVGDTHDYGHVLLAVGERFAAPLPFAASLMGPRGTLERRIKAMSAPRHRRPLLAALPFGIIAVAAITGAARAPRPAPLALLTSLGRHDVSRAKAFDGATEGRSPTSPSPSNQRRSMRVPRAVLPLILAPMISTAALEAQSPMLPPASADGCRNAESLLSGRRLDPSTYIAFALVARCGQSGAAVLKRLWTPCPQDDSTYVALLRDGTRLIADTTMAPAVAAVAQNRGCPTLSRLRALEVIETELTGIVNQYRFVDKRFVPPEIMGAGLPSVVLAPGDPRDPKEIDQRVMSVGFFLDSPSESLSFSPDARASLFGTLRTMAADTTDSCDVRRLAVRVAVEAQPQPPDWKPAKLGCE